MPVEPVCVCSEDELISSRKKAVTVHDRDIVLIHHKDAFYALDKQCYHAGGSLQSGVVKDIEDHPCVVCPFHKYVICLDTGEGMYQSVSLKYPDSPPKWTSRGVKQRTHLVEVKNGQVFVTLSDLTEKIESDYYHSKEYKEKMAASLRRMQECLNS